MQLGRQKICHIVKINQTHISNSDKKKKKYICLILFETREALVLPIRERMIVIWSIRLATVHTRRSCIKYPNLTHRRRDWGGNEFPHSHTPVDTQMQMPCHPKFSSDKHRSAQRGARSRGCSPRWKIHTQLLPACHLESRVQKHEPITVSNSTVWTQCMHFDRRKLRHTETSKKSHSFLRTRVCAHTHAHTLLDR